MLVAAAFDADLVTVTLTFDRAVDVSGIVPEDLLVASGALSGQWIGTSEFSHDTPEQIVVTMTDDGPFLGTGVTLTATDGAGIVGETDATPWAGVSELTLPFP